MAYRAAGILWSDSWSKYLPYTDFAELYFLINTKSTRSTTYRYSMVFWAWLLSYMVFISTQEIKSGLEAACQVSKDEEKST